MKDLNPQQKAAVAKRKLGPSSLLAFWKRPITGYITSTSLPGKGIPYWSSSSMPLFIPPTRPFAQCAAHGCVPLTINTQINTLVFSCKICWRVQCPKITQEKNDTPPPSSALTSQSLTWLWVISCPSDPFVQMMPDIHAEGTRWSHFQSAIGNSRCPSWLSLMWGDVG